LTHAYNYARKAAQENKTFLFIGTKSSFFPERELYIFKFLLKSDFIVDYSELSVRI